MTDRYLVTIAVPADTHDAALRGAEGGRVIGCRRFDAEPFLVGLSADLSTFQHLCGADLLDAEMDALFILRRAVQALTGHARNHTTRKKGTPS